MDIQVIARAIAARFDPTVCAAPSGLKAIRLTTEQLPNALTVFPTVLVMPPDETLSYTASMRTSQQLWPVNFYLDDPADLPRSTTDLYLWRSVLIEALTGQVQLGATSSGVAWARIETCRTGVASYAGIDYPGIVMTVHVSLSEGITFTA